MGIVTFDGTNAAEVAQAAGDRFEGAVLLVRNDDGQLTLVWPGYVLDRRDDGGLGIYSASAWHRRIVPLTGAACLRRPAYVA